MTLGKGKQFLPLGLIILISILFRFIYLDRIPSAVTGDELHYALVAKTAPVSSLAPVFLFRYPPNEKQAELPYFLHLPATKLLPFSLFWFKVPFALLGVGVVILLYLIAKELFGDRVGIATGLVAAVNPWLMVMGRTGYETMPSTFFYLLGLYIVLKTTSWNILWSVIPFMLAFYSYIGTKVIFVPFVLISAWLGYHLHKRHSGKQYMILCLFSLCFVLLFWYLMKTSTASVRLGDLFLPSSPLVASQVDELRRTSLQTTFLPLAVNKYTVYSQMLLSKMFRIFSPAYLFVEGDQFFLPVKQGFFYVLDAVFLFLGALYIFAKRKFLALTLFALIGIGTLPHLVSTNMGDFSNHLTMLFPFMIILIGLGIGSLSRRLLIIVSCALYALLVAGFIQVYAFQYPVANSGEFPMRVLVNYLRLARNAGFSLTVYTGRNGDLLQNYLFYTNGPIRDVNTQKPFEYNGIHFINCDDKITKADPSQTTVHETVCAMTIPGTAHIARLNDGGHVYTIANDQLCSQMSLNAYPTGVTFSSLNIEALTTSQFCQTFVSR